MEIIDSPDKAKIVIIDYASLIVLVSTRCQMGKPGTFLCIIITLCVYILCVYISLIVFIFSCFFKGFICCCATDTDTDVDAGTG